MPTWRSSPARCRRRSRRCPSASRTSPTGRRSCRPRRTWMPGTTSGRLIAESPWTSACCRPGDYVAVVEVMDGKRLLGRRVQPLTVDRTVPAAGAAAASASGVRVRFAAGDASSLVKAFSRQDVLGTRCPALLRRAHAAGRSHRPRQHPVVVVAAARPASSTRRWPRSRTQPAGSLSASFLKGLALLGRNELEAAAQEFREALRIADDFLPAAFYLGACYAAGGRDSEAVAPGRWPWSPRATRASSTTS